MIPLLYPEGASIELLRQAIVREFPTASHVTVQMRRMLDRFDDDVVVTIGLGTELVTVECTAADSLRQVWTQVQAFVKQTMYNQMVAADTEDWYDVAPSA